jgi:pyruvate ferredoxin oxidoreductase beta subunit
VFEAERGDVVAVSPIRRGVPVEEYLRLQRRFAHLFDAEGRVTRPETVAGLQAVADRNVARYGLLAGEGA